MKRKNVTRVLLMAMVMAVFCSGCSKAGTRKEEGNGTVTQAPSSEEEKGEDTILTVGDCSYGLNDMMYYIYIEEELGWWSSDMYASINGEDYNYWEEESEGNSGLTGAEAAKEAVILGAKKDLVWYQEALKRGISLEEEDKKAAQEAYDSFCEELTDKQKNTSGMGEELLAYFEKQQVIEKYKESLLSEAEFDEEEVSKGVSKEDNREYVFEYFEIYKEDENEKTVPEKKLKEYVKILQQLAKKLNKDSDMESMIPEKYAEIIAYSDDVLIASQTDYYGEYNNVNIDKEIMKLKNGEVSDVYETEVSYLVVRMKDNNSTEYYEEMVMEAVETAKNEVYDTAYENAVDSYNIELNEEKWNDITIGNLIYEY